jgi:hypothetical protein
LKKTSQDAKKTQIQPIALYEKIIIEFPIMSARDKTLAVPLGV